MEPELKRLKAHASLFSRPNWPAESVKEFVAGQQHRSLTAWLSLATAEIDYDSLTSDEALHTEHAPLPSLPCMYNALTNRMRLASQHIDNSSSSSNGKRDDFRLSLRNLELCSMLLLLKMLVLPSRIVIGTLVSHVDNLILLAMVDLAEDLASTPSSEQPAQGSAQLVTAVAHRIMVTFKMGMEGFWQLHRDLGDRKCSLPLDLLRCFSVLTPSEQEAAATEIGSSGGPSAVLQLPCSLQNACGIPNHLCKHGLVNLCMLL